jgi:hypothetical protein
LKLRSLAIIDPEPNLIVPPYPPSTLIECINKQDNQSGDLGKQYLLLPSLQFNFISSHARAVHVIQLPVNLNKSIDFHQLSELVPSLISQLHHLPSPVTHQLCSTIVSHLASSLVIPSVPTLYIGIRARHLF